jgi:hypothetical protein
MDDDAPSAESIARAARIAREQGNHAYLMDALEGLVKGTPEVRFDALARVSDRDALVLLCALAEGERHRVTTEGAGPLSREHVDVLIVAAAVKDERELRRQIAIEIEDLAELGWSPPS